MKQRKLHKLENGYMQVLLELNYRTGINALDTTISLGDQLQFMHAVFASWRFKRFFSDVSIAISMPYNKIIFVFQHVTVSSHSKEMA